MANENQGNKGQAQPQPAKAAAQATAVVSAPRKKKYTFQVLAGRHWEPGEVTDTEGRTKVKDIMYGPGCPAGDIVEVDIDLAKRFNVDGYPPKFRRIGEDGVVDEHIAEIKAERQRANVATSDLVETLEMLSREALIAWAEKRNIDLKGQVKQDQVLRIIKEHLGSVSPS